MLAEQIVAAAALWCIEKVYAMWHVPHIHFFMMNNFIEFWCSNWLAAIKKIADKIFHTAALMCPHLLNNHTADQCRQINREVLSRSLGDRNIARYDYLAQISMSNQKTLPTQPLLFIRGSARSTGQGKSNK